MRARRLVVPVLVLLLAALAVPAPAATVPDGRVEVTVADGEYLILNGRRYRGPLVVSSHSDGLAVIEVTPLDGYLEGIREVPFSWEAEALRAQVVAARTYLMATLQGGPTRTGARIGYDICATTACQVYAGVEALLGPDGERWRQAVAATSGEILVHEGRPIWAFYGSTTGGRTRNIEDIWPGADPAPYLVAVDSSGEESPYVEWRWELPEDQMELLLADAGVIAGDLIEVQNHLTSDGEGPWSIEFVSDTGTVTIDTWTLRGRINAAAQRIMPDRLPALSPQGRRYPTTVLSPQFSITHELRIGHRGDDAYLARPSSRYVVEGAGWGHLIGMSQYGAQKMAGDGASYDDILAHYYGGLRPVDGTDLLPATVRVGLVTGAGSVLIEGTAPLDVTVGGLEMSAGNSVWRFKLGPDAGLRAYPLTFRDLYPAPGQDFIPN